jgi:hypothetical protein
MNKMPSLFGDGTLTQRALFSRQRLPLRVWGETARARAMLQDPDVHGW